MAYKLENFLVQVSATDRLLKIKESSGIIKHTIDGFSITSLRAVNNIVKIITKSNTIDLDFSTTNEARIALSRIQAQIDLLKEKTPLIIDKKISNYVNEYAGTGFADRYSATSSTPLQVPTIGDIVLLYTQTELGYTPGQSVLAYNTLIDNFFNEDYIEEETSISFQGQVDGYDTSTGLLSLLIDNSVGYGLTTSQNQIATYSFWYLNIIGQIGPQGAGATGPQGFADRYSATSSTPLQVPDVGYVANLVTQTSLAYTPGQSVLVYNTLTENYMEDDYVEEDSSILFIGQIDNYIPSTGDLQLVVSSSVGFGLTDSNNETATYSFWYINITGQTGQDGPQGPSGLDGTTASFTELTVTGPSNIQQVVEVLTTATSGPGLLTNPTASTFNLNFDYGSIFYIEPEGENFVANYLNFPTTDNRIISTTIIISQTAPAYIPNVVAIDGDIIPISWANSSLPSGNANQTDIVGLSFMRIGATWSKVFGQLSTFATI
jgi:hypothetical protein